MASKNQHVVQHKGDWAVRGAGNQRVTSTHTTQAAAIDAARDIAIRQQAEMFIHRPNGQIRERNTYSQNDPYPPKG